MVLARYSLEARKENVLTVNWIAALALQECRESFFLPDVRNLASPLNIKIWHVSFLKTSRGHEYACSPRLLSGLGLTGNVDG